VSYFELWTAADKKAEALAAELKTVRARLAEVEGERTRRGCSVMGPTRSGRTSAPRTPAYANRSTPSPTNWPRSATTRPSRSYARTNENLSVEVTRLRRAPIAHLQLRIEEVKRDRNHYMAYAEALRADLEDAMNRHDETCSIKAERERLRREVASMLAVCSCSIGPHYEGPGCRLRPTWGGRGLQCSIGRPRRHAPGRGGGGGVGPRWHRPERCRPSRAPSG